MSIPSYDDVDDDESDSPQTRGEAMADVEESTGRNVYDDAPDDGGGGGAPMPANTGGGDDSDQAPDPPTQSELEEAGVDPGRVGAETNDTPETRGEAMAEVEATSERNVYEDPTGENVVQGEETLADDPRVRDQATDLEQRALKETPGIDDESAVRITRDDDTLQAELTSAGRRRLRERQANQLERELQGETGRRVTVEQSGGQLGVRTEATRGTAMAQVEDMLRGRQYQGAELNERDVEIETGMKIDGDEVRPGRETQDQQTSQTVDLTRSPEDEIERNLESQTGVNLTASDINITRADGNVTGRLSRQGEVTVAQERTPFQNVPLLSPLLEAGARTRVQIERGRQDIFGTVQEATPNVGVFTPPGEEETDVIGAIQELGTLTRRELPPELREAVGRPRGDRLGDTQERQVRAALQTDPESLTDRAAARARAAGLPSSRGDRLGDRQEQEFWSAVNDPGSIADETRDQLPAELRDTVDRRRGDRLGYRQERQVRAVFEQDPATLVERAGARSRQAGLPSSRGDRLGESQENQIWSAVRNPGSIGDEAGDRLPPELRETVDRRRGQRLSDPLDRQYRSLLQSATTDVDSQIESGTDRGLGTAASFGGARSLDGAAEQAAKINAAFSASNAYTVNDLIEGRSLDEAGGQVEPGFNTRLTPTYTAAAPGSGNLRLARGAAGITALAGGAAAANELEVPEENDIDQPEVTVPDEAVSDQRELEVQEDPTVEEVPTRQDVFTQEVEPEETVSTTEVQLPEEADTEETADPEDDSVVPGDYPLAGRDMPANPTREYVGGESGQAVAQATGALQEGTIQDEEAEEEDDDELGPPDDPFLESDRRLRDPSRTFGKQEPIEDFVDPTSEGVRSEEDIGTGITGTGGAMQPARGDTVAENWQRYLAEQEAQRLEEAQQREVLAEEEIVAEEEDLETAAESTLSSDAQATTVFELLEDGVLGPDEIADERPIGDERADERGDEAIDTRERGDEAADEVGAEEAIPAPDQALLQDQIAQQTQLAEQQVTTEEVGNPTVTEQVFEFPNPPEYQYPTETVNVPEYGTPYLPGFGTPPGPPDRPRGIDGDLGDDDVEARIERFGETWETGIAQSLEDVLDNYEGDNWP